MKAIVLIEISGDITEQEMTEDNKFGLIKELVQSGAESFCMDSTVKLLSMESGIDVIDRWDNDSCRKEYVKGYTKDGELVHHECYGHYSEASDAIDKLNKEEHIFYSEHIYINSRQRSIDVDSEQLEKMREERKGEKSAEKSNSEVKEETV